MTLLDPWQGFILIGLFAIAMCAITYFITLHSKWNEGFGFLIANRQIGWVLGSASIAASWVWAPALFVSVQKSYELGLAGLFWFTVPNVLALVVFSVLAPRIRSVMPVGYTLPDWIRYRFPTSKLLHRIYLVPYLWYQVMAITVQVFVGGMMLNYLTGIDLNVLMVALLLVGLSYSLGSGISASIVTDFVQMSFILIGILIVIPLLIFKVGFSAISQGLGGTDGSVNVLDWDVAFSFGVVTSIGLVAGAICDQQHWQRAFSIRRSDLGTAFVVGGILFGVVPASLSLLGFVAAVPEFQVSLPDGTGLPMIGVAAVAKLLPAWVAIVFVVMLLGGLCSTLDSGMCAAAALFAVDIAGKSEVELSRMHQESANDKSPSETESLKQLVRYQARLAMIGIAIIGLLVAFVVQHLFSLDRLWWIFNGVAVCFVVPTVLSLFYSRLSATAVVSAISCSLIGMAAFVYGNWVQNDLITVGSSVAIILVSFACCVLLPADQPWTPPNTSASTNAD